MKRKSILILAVICAFTLGLFCGCGGSEPAEEPAETSAAAQTELSTDQLIDVITKDLDASLTQLDDLHQGLVGEDGSIEITFKMGGEDCSYTLNAYTGEILDKNVPEAAMKAKEEAGDTTQAAMDAAFDSIDGFDGSASNISMSEEGSTIIVEFDYHGEHVEKTYDTDKGELVD